MPASGTWPNVSMPWRAVSSLAASRYAAACVRTPPSSWIGSMMSAATSSARSASASASTSPNGSAPQPGRCGPNGSRNMPGFMSAQLPIVVPWYATYRLITL